MKLIDDVPTAEILAIISNEKEVFDSPEALYAALYAAVPETQQELVAEIAKRDVLIKELTYALGQPVPLSDWQKMELQLEEQAAEIARLKAVIGKCEGAIDTYLNPCGCFQGCEFCNGKVSFEEALAAIKEEGL